MRRTRARRREARSRIGGGWRRHKKNARNPRHKIEARCRKWMKLGEEKEKRTQESFGSVDVDRGYLENRKEVRREVQGVQG